MHQKRIRPDQLIAELQTHVAEVAKSAMHGDYEARQWLCESFQGHTAFFHAVWSKPVRGVPDTKKQEF